VFIYIGGVPASGKTTVIKLLEKKALREKIKVEKMIGLPILCDLADVKTEDELRKLSEERRKKLRPLMYGIIRSRMRQKPDTLWIFDGHFCYFDLDGRKFGVRPIQSWDRELMIGIVVLTAQPKTILKRREKDERIDRKLDIDFIREEIKKETRIAQSQASKLKKPIKFIVNEDGNANMSAKEILHLIKKWKRRL